MKREPKKSDSLEVRLPHETKTAFMAACAARGTSASGVLRGFIHRYIASARTSLDWKKELIMLFTTKARRRLAAACAGIAGTAALILAVTAPAQAANEARLRAVFDWMDADRDGSLSRVEFMTARQDPPPVQAIEIEVTTRTRPAEERPDGLFSRLDANGDGILAVGEFAAECSVRTIVTDAIADADVDRNSQLTEAELAAFLAADGEGSRRTERARAATIFAQGIIADHDHDGDGKVVLADLRS